MFCSATLTTGPTYSYGPGIPSRTRGQSINTFMSQSTDRQIDISKKHVQANRLIPLESLAFPDLLNKRLLVSVIPELDYVLLEAVNLNVFGYGKTHEEATSMLYEDLCILRDDLNEGLINETNTEAAELNEIRDLFQHGT